MQTVSTTQPGAGVTPTGGTVGTAEGTRPTKTLSTTMNAEPEVLDLARFNSFKDIVRDIAAVAIFKRNRSSKIMWFIASVARITPAKFNSITVNNFLQEFPDSNFVHSAPLPYSEALVEDVCARIESVVYFWIAHSPTIRGILVGLNQILLLIFLGLFNSFEAGRVSGRKLAAQAVPNTQPEATVGTTIGTEPTRPSIVFDYRYQNNSENVARLDEYIKVGQQIKNGPGYENSAIWNLEKFLCHGRPEVKRYLGHNHFKTFDDQLRKAFYALAAPSLEGKTQSAFVFRDVKPLYFVISTGLNTRSAQMIYNNFLALSDRLLDFARMDLEHIRQVNVNRGLENDLDLKHISPCILSGSHPNQKFYVLGFIKALILDARTNYQDTHDTTWMKYYVSTDRRMEVIPTSINEFWGLRDSIKGFVLFLDEFTGSPENLVNVLIRNLARAANFKAVVASTNVKATNLANPYQRNPNGHSRIEISAWAIVFTKLNPFNSGSVPDLDELKNELFDKVKARERSDLEVFYQNFLEVQVKQMRPGFVNLIVDAMKRFSQSFVRRRFSLNEFISCVVHDLGSELNKRKPDLTDSDAGLIGTKALYFANAYGSALDKDVDLISHCKQYLDSHFYYLLNPVDPSKCCFLTYPNTTGTRVREVIAEQAFEPPELEGDSCLDIFLEDIFLRRSIDRTWKPELTIFEKNETLPFLAFQGIWHDESISNILGRAKLSVEDVYIDTSNAATRSGNVLEVLSTISSINASHHDLDSEKMTFTGQGCKSYLSNLIKNLISADNCRIRSDYKVAFPTKDVAFIFDRIHVPFLFPSNIPIPQSFWSRFTNADQFRTRSIHLGTVKRTVNRARIDFKFDLFLKDVSGTGYTKGICTIECKDSERDIEFAGLKDIFGKAQNNGASLSLLICDKIVESSEPKDFSELKAECIARNWEIFKVVQRPPKAPNAKVFAIERLHPKIRLPSPKNCTMACVILELDVINA